METGKKAPSMQACLLNKAAPCTQKAEEDRSLWVSGQPGLYNELQTSQGTWKDPVFNKNNNVHYLGESRDSRGSGVSHTHTPSHLQNWKRARWGAKSKGTTWQGLTLSWNSQGPHRVSELQDQVEALEQSKGEKAKAVRRHQWEIQTYHYKTYR